MSARAGPWLNRSVRPRGMAIGRARRDRTEEGEDAALASIVREGHRPTRQVVRYRVVTLELRVEAMSDRNHGTHPSRARETVDP